MRLHNILHALDEAAILRGCEFLDLVPAGVEVRSRGHACDLANYVVQELVGHFLFDAEYPERPFQPGVQRRRGAVTVQLRVRRERGSGVGGMSISGTIVMKRSLAYETISAYWACE